MAPADAPALERLVHGGLPRLMAYPALVSIFSQPTAVSSSSQSQSPSPRCYSSSFQPAVIATPSFSSSLSGWFCGAVTLRIADTRLRRRSHIVRMAPEEERMTRRSPLDFLIVSFFDLHTLLLSFLKDQSLSISCIKVPILLLKIRKLSLEFA